MEIGSVCFGLLSGLATIGARLYCVVQEIECARDSLDDLIASIKSTETQISTIQEYLEKAALSNEQKARCEHHLRDTEIRSNKFVNSIDSIIQRLGDKSLRKVKQKLKLINGELDGLKYQIDKIDRNLSAIRQELMIGIALDERRERRVTTALVVEKLDVIEANTTGTDARKLRKQYKAYAQELMMDDFTMPPPYTATATPSVQPLPTTFNPYTATVTSSVQPLPTTFSPFSVASPLISQLPYPDEDKMPLFSTVVTHVELPANEKVVPSSWTPPVPRRPRNYGYEPHSDLF